MVYGICHALPAILPLVLASLRESGVAVAQMIEPGDLKIEAEFRYHASIQFVFRVARQDVVVADQRIRAGVPTFVVLGAVNCAPAVFGDSARCDIECNPNPSLAYGVHCCLGAALARFEAHSAIPEFFKCVLYFEYVLTDPLKPRSALHVWGPESLPIQYSTSQSSEPHKGGLCVTSFSFSW